jgi:hypothetical protein
MVALGFVLATHSSQLIEQEVSSSENSQELDVL